MARIPSGLREVSSLLSLSQVSRIESRLPVIPCLCPPWFQLPNHGSRNQGGHKHGMTGKRDSIRETCDRLRRLLTSRKPDGILAILQEVGTIECDAVIANSGELQAVEEKLDGLLRRLTEQGAIDEERWIAFFGCG